MSILPPEGHISTFIGNGKVTHCVKNGDDKTLCGKVASRTIARDAGIACKVCAKLAETVAAQLPASDTGSAAQEKAETPADRNKHTTDQVNALIEEVRTALRAGDDEAASKATDEADRLMAPLPPSMRGMLRAALMEARQTEPEPVSDEDEGAEPAAPAVHNFDSTKEAYDATQSREEIKDGDVLVIESERVVGFLYKAWPAAVTAESGELHTTNGKESAWDDGKYVRSVEVAELAARNLGFPLAKDEESVPTEEAITSKGDIALKSAADAEQADDMPASSETPDNEPERAEDQLRKMHDTSVEIIFQTTASRKRAVWELATVELGARTLILDKDGDPDVHARSQAARDFASRVQATAKGLIPQDDDNDLSAEIKSITRAKQTAMRDVIVEYVKSLDSNPEEATKFVKAREAFPDLSPTEAVYAYYEMQDKALPRQTRAEVERARRALAKEAKAEINPTAKDKEEPNETPANEAPEEPKGQEPTQHDKDMSALKTMQSALIAIIKRAAEAPSEERDALKAQAEALMSAAGPMVAAL